MIIMNSTGLGGELILCMYTYIVHAQFALCVCVPYMCFCCIESDTISVPIS